MKRKIFSILSIVFALVLALSFSLVSAVPAGAGVNGGGGPNPTFATLDMTDLFHPTTPSAQISIKWERDPAIAGEGFSAPDAIHVTTSTATFDYAMVIVPTNFILESATPISYWGYTAGGDVKALDEIYLFLDIDGNGTFNIGAGDILLLSHQPGPVASAWYSQWHEWTLGDATNQWHTYPYVDAVLADYIGKTVLAIALTAGPSDLNNDGTIDAVNIDVYFDKLTVGENVLLDNDTGVIDVPVPFAGFPAPCIQDAINAALPGDTINVAAGTYDEQVVITQGLTLQGAGDTTIIQPSQATANAFQLFARGTDSVNDSAPIVVATTNGGTVNIQNLKIDGSLVTSVPGGASMFAGILYRDTNGLINHVTIESISIIDIGASPLGCGMYLVGHDTAVNVGVTNCNVSGYEKNGITANFPNMTANIHHNTVTGMGPTDAIAQNGIQIGFGATGAVNTNTVSGHVWTDTYADSNDPATDPDADGAAGILLYHPGGTVEIGVNTLTANQFGIWTVGAASINVHENNITGLAHTGNAFPAAIAVWDADMWSDDYGYTEVATTAIINANTFDTHDYGVLVRDYIAGEAAPTATVTGNNFSNNWIQVADAAGTLDIAAILASNTFDRAVTVDHEGASLRPLILSSIQDGINVALDGDTVFVAAGEYNESVTVNKALTLSGANAGIPGTGTRGAESIIDADYDGDWDDDGITIASGGVTIDGFKIIEADDPIIAMFSASTGDMTNIIIKNNYIDNAAGATRTSGTEGICFIAMDGHYSADGAVIKNNYIKPSQDTNAMSLDGVTGSFTIEGNTIEDARNGLWLSACPNNFTWYDRVSLTGTEIKDNIIQDLRCSWSTGIGLSYVDGDINITGNTVACNVSNSIGLQSGSSWHETNYHPGSYATGLNIQDNDIYNNGWAGVYLIDGSDDISIHWNNIYNNGSYGVHGAGAASVVDATNNWWGSVYGPEDATGTIESLAPSEGGWNCDVCDLNAEPAGQLGDGVFGNVDYCPWLTQQWTNQVWVDDDWQIEPPPYAEDTDNDLYFATIQAAIDAVPPGATITCAAGTYTEEVTIGVADLTLRSESPLGAIIRPLATPANHGAAIYISADGVTVDGFEIDGTTVCNNGIYGWDTSGLTIKNNKIHGAVNAWDGCGILLISWGNAGTVYDNLIEGNEIYDTGRVGIMVMDHGANYTVTSGNTITGNTVHDVWKKATAWGDGGGGIQINVGKDCAITNNKVYNVQDGQRGIYMFGSAEGNTITGNTLRDNPIGIQLWISGEQPTPEINWGEETPTSPAVHFNNIYDNSLYGAKSTNIQGTLMVMDATKNWWGTTDGTAIATMVSDNVDYDPWLGASLVASKTETVTDGGTLDGSADIGVTVGVTGGSATVTVAKYSGNPGTGSFSGSTGQYVDIHLANVVGVTEIEIRVYYTSAEVAGKVEASLALRWWDGTSWVLCSDRGVNTADIVGPPAYSGYMWAKISATSTPNLGDLEGTPFGGGGSPVIMGGGGVAPPPTTVSKVGSVSLLQYLDLQGKTRIKIILTSDDDVLTVTIPSATLVQNVGGNPLESMGIVTLSTPPPPPGYALVGHAYDCLPDGANFAPDVTMTFAYDPADIPDGASEADLLAAYWDGDEWVNMPTTVNAAANTVTTGVGHFTPFALIAPLPPAAPAAFSVSNLSIQPAEVQPNEAVTVTFSVANTGGSEGSYSVVLKINGATEAERSITLAAGESQDVSFSITKAEAASYNVTVEGLSGSFTVVTPPAEEEEPEAGLPISWTLIWIIAAAVVVVGLIIFFVVRQRA